jgi:cell shape-determining protein MreD
VCVCVCVCVCSLLGCTSLRFSKIHAIFILFFQMYFYSLLTSIAVIAVVKSITVIALHVLALLLMRPSLCNGVFPL